MIKLRVYGVSGKGIAAFSRLLFDFQNVCRYTYFYARGQGSHLNTSRVESCPTREKVRTNQRAIPRFTF